MEKELGPLGEQLEDKVSHLTDGLGNGRLANHVLEAEDHAKQLNESAAILDGYANSHPNKVNQKQFFSGYSDGVFFLSIYDFWHCIL